MAVTGAGFRSPGRDRRGSGSTGKSDPGNLRATRHRKIVFITVLLFSILPGASALPSPVCDVYSIALHGDPVMTGVSGTGEIIAAGGAGGTIGTFTPRGTPRWVCRINEPVTGISLSKDGRFVAATTFYGNLFYFDDNGTLLWNRSGFGCDSHVALSGDGQEGYVFSGSPTHDLTGDTVFHVAGNGSVLSRLPVSAASDYAFSPEGPVAVVNSGGPRGNNYIVAIDGNGIRWEKKVPEQWRVPTVAISDDCSTVAAIVPGTVTVFSCWGKTLWNTTTRYIAKSVAVSGNGQHVAVGTQYRVLYFNRSGSRLWEYTVPDYVGQIKASADGTRVIGATRQALYYLDGNGTRLWEQPLKDWPESVSMSDTGDLIAVGSYNNTFTILDGGGKATEIALDTLPGMPPRRAEAESPDPLSPAGDQSVGESGQVSGSPVLPVNITSWLSAGPEGSADYPPPGGSGRMKVFSGPDSNRWPEFLNTTSVPAGNYPATIVPVKTQLPSRGALGAMTHQRATILQTTGMPEPTMPESPVIFFDEFSSVEPMAGMNRSYYDIPPFIRNVTIISVDAKSLKSRIDSGKDVTIRVNGSRYFMVLRKEALYPEKLPGSDYYVGHLEDVPERTIQDCLVFMTMSDGKMSGRVSCSGSHGYFIESTGKPSGSGPEKTLHYVYSDRDVWRVPVDPEFPASRTTPLARSAGVAPVIASSVTEITGSLRQCRERS